MTTYEPGTVATATVPIYEPSRGEDTMREARVSRYSDGWVLLTDPDIFWADNRGLVTDIRPLVVLVLDGPADYAKTLRTVAKGRGCYEHFALSSIAHQIEEQTKPSRIPEPGLWGVVEAHTEGNPSRFRYGKSKNDTWIREGSSVGYSWHELIDPTLVREGVES